MVEGPANSEFLGLQLFQDLVQHEIGASTTRIWVKIGYSWMIEMWT
jgi:hypothetical protein